MSTIPLFIFPVISITVWLAMLLAMLIHWCLIDKPFYVSELPGQTIAFISDVGASSYKPLFVTGCCITVLSLDLSLAAERWLLPKIEIEEKKRMSDKFAGIMSVGGAVVGSLGLVLLSILDVVHHRKLHQSLLIVALAGYLTSAVLLCWERRRLRKDHGKHYLRSVGFYIKVVFVSLEAMLICAFLVCFSRYNDPAAVLEWTIAFFFVLYATAFLVDLFPANRQSEKREDSVQSDREVGKESNRAKERSPYFLPWGIQ